jgi:hypothetical protein
MGGRYQTSQTMALKEIISLWNAAT